MMWVLLAAGSAVFYALHGAWSARVAREIGSLWGAWSLFAFSLPFMAGALAIRGVPEVEPVFWVALGVNLLLSLLSWSLFFLALRVGELGALYPILALTPLFAVPVEWALTGALPARPGLGGILLMVAGVAFVTSTGPEGAPSSQPGEPLEGRIPRGSLLMLGVAFLWSVGGTVDRVAVLASSPELYGVLLSGGLALLFLPLALVRSARPWPERGGAPGFAWEEGRLGGRAGALVLHGFLFAAMFLLQMAALEGALASYVLSIKRTGSILAVLMGALLFREGALARRLLGAILTVGGAAILLIWG